VPTDPLPNRFRLGVVTVAPNVKGFKLIPMPALAKVRQLLNLKLFISE